MNNNITERSIYRHYQLDGNIHRLGCGEVACSNQPLIQHLDVNTLDYSFSIIVSGSLWFKDQAGQVTILKKDDIFQRKPGVQHSTCVVPTQEYREQFCLMSGELYAHFNRMGLVPTEITFTSEHHPESTKHFTQLSLALRSDSPNWYKKAMNAMQNWLFLLDSRKRLTHESIDSCKQALAKEKLLSNWNTPIPLIAKDMGLSYSTFRKWFTQEIGMTPGGFRKLSRIKLACDLLLTPELSITYVSEALGYPDIYSFSKQFKQVVGMTPSLFRQQPQRNQQRHLSTNR
ncbi:helix-turn-helix transcriptional regulator [Vibrio sp. JPW-9-11-11]|uniref:helix-turn-helix domain-containing protein n=1 Tax=Vibrio sp. JPW-9-11-11 TaxID=1416532 RepID=UPI001593FB6E|nr:AraC family transcriptional regulator [Vibrio sp. JPW-9-11-11]NVD07099.1 helix-turn-helix transcriptional regulator [Vibrio sp. JPW-9-11-11]